MATIETFTKERILAIEKNTVVGGQIVDDSLVLTKQDGGTINAGVVRGDTGPAGPGFQANLVDSVKYPLIIAHRGGMSLFPEESMEGLKWCSEAGYAIEVDVYKNASGSLVCCHDATVTRTMTNISGNVVDKTDAEWRAARIKSPVKGGASSAAIFFEDVLDRFGGRAMLVPEVKTYDDATVNAFMQAIIGRGLEKSVIVQAFDYNTCVRMASNGLTVIYLVSGTSTPQTPAVISAAGIAYVGCNVNNFTQTTVQNLVTAGVQVIGFNVNSPAGQEPALAKGMVGIFSDDPWFSSRQIQTSGNMPLDDPAKGALWPGAKFYSYPSGDPVTSPEAIYLAHGGVGIHYQAADPRMRFLTCPWAEPVNDAFFIVIKGVFGTSADNQADSIGGVLWKNTSNADALWEDRAKVGQTGYTWLVRRNGQIAIWDYINGAAATLIASSTAGDDNASYIAPPNNLGEFTLVLQHTGSSLRLSLTDSNRPLPVSISAADNNTKTNLKFGFRYNSSGFITASSVTPA